MHNKRSFNNTRKLDEYMKNMIYLDMNVFIDIAQERNNWKNILRKIFALKKTYCFPYSPAHMEELANLCRLQEGKCGLIRKNIKVISDVSDNMELLPGIPSLKKITDLRQAFAESTTPISADMDTVLSTTEREWNLGRLSSLDQRPRLVEEPPIACLKRVLNDLPVTDFALCNDIFHMGRKNRKSLEENFMHVNRNKKENLESFVDMRQRLGIDTSKLNNLKGKEVFLQSGVKAIFQNSCRENGLNPKSIPTGKELIKNYELLEAYVTVCMNVLDKAGYYSDKENDVLKLRSRMNDISHAIYGSVTDYFVSDDIRLIKRIASTYLFLGISTIVCDTNKFMEI